MRGSCAISFRPELQKGSRKAGEHPSTHWYRSLDTFWHLPHLIFLLEIFFVIKFFLLSKISTKLYSQVQFSIYIWFTFIQFWKNSKRMLPHTFARI